MASGFEAETWVYFRTMTERPVAVRRNGSCVVGLFDSGVQGEELTSI